MVRSVMPTLVESTGWLATAAITALSMAPGTAFTSQLPGLDQSVETDPVQVKAEPKFKDFDLVRISRLSVMPVSEVQWALLLKLAGEKGKLG